MPKMCAIPAAITIGVPWTSAVIGEWYWTPSSPRLHNTFPVAGSKPEIALPSGAPVSTTSTPVAIVGEVANP